MRAAVREETPRARAKREQIRNGARRLFLRHGFAQTTTEAIAAEAGVSKQTLYVYYPSKESLLRDVLQQVIDTVPAAQLDLPPARQEADGHGALRDALIRMGTAIVKAGMEPDYLALMRVIIAETPRLPQLGDLYRSTIPERGWQRIADTLKQAEAQGLAHIHDQDVAVRMFIGPLITYMLLDGLLADAPRMPGPAQIEAIVDTFLKAIV